ncbi:hypothetical protein EVAR_56954_1 [Eumeta japonica]|uniref:Uncharacterized protein n=1 Tax=Eumeta variegata TaxID=151549 RepID=A0A4C1YM44_EUMVA|nr:hypothetical protein EVAR_56954_1 [Eumeta japonica]
MIANTWISGDIEITCKKHEEAVGLDLSVSLAASAIRPTSPKMSEGPREVVELFMGLFQYTTSISLVIGPAESAPVGRPPRPPASAPAAHLPHKFTIRQTERKVRGRIMPSRVRARALKLPQGSPVRKACSLIKGP